MYADMLLVYTFNMHYPQGCTTLHHVKKGSKLKISSGDIDDGPGQEPIPLNSKLWCFFLFPLIIFIMSFNIDVGVVINAYHRHLRGEGAGIHDSHVGRACNDCNGSTICIYPEQKTSA